MNSHTPFGSQPEDIDRFTSPGIQVDDIDLFTSPDIQDQRNIISIPDTEVNGVQDEHDIISIPDTEVNGIQDEHNIISILDTEVNGIQEEWDIISIPDTEVNGIQDGRNIICIPDTEVNGSYTNCFTFLTQNFPNRTSIKPLMPLAQDLFSCSPTMLSIFQIPPTIFPSHPKTSRLRAWIFMLCPNPPPSCI
jgi:hypothetical protein